VLKIKKENPQEIANSGWYGEATRALKSLTKEEIDDVLKDVTEYPEVYRKLAAREKERRTPVRLTDLLRNIG
jgi:hypothetical protein